MGNRPSSGAEGTHVAEILQSPSTKDETKIATGYSSNSCGSSLVVVAILLSDFIQLQINSNGNKTANIYVKTLFS